jgi:hypothetical protein
MLGAIFIFPNQVNNFNIHNYEMFNYPFLLIVQIILYSAIITVWAYVIYYLLDCNQIVYTILAFIIGGLVMTVFFAVVRLGYRKVGFTFLN